MSELKTLSILLFMFYGQQVLAHAPYYTQSQQMQTAEFGSVELKLLHGDGIITTDPVRAIVVDSDLRLRAVSPLGLDFHIICEREDEQSCVVYDAIGSLVFEMTEEDWEIGPVAETGARLAPVMYPEDMDYEFGFAARPPTSWEIVRFEGARMRAYPLSAGLAVLWWTLIAMIIVPLLRSVATVERVEKLKTTAGIITTTLRSGIVVLLLVLTYMSWVWVPSSLYSMGFYALAGSCIAFAYCGWRRRG